MDILCGTIPAVSYCLAFFFIYPDIGTREAHSKAQSRRRRRRVRVESLWIAERRCRSTSIARRADDQRENRRETKVIHHHTVDGAEPATHCPTQRGNIFISSQCLSLSYRRRRTVTCFVWHVWLSLYVTSSSCVFTSTPLQRYGRLGQQDTAGAMYWDFFLFSSSNHRFENWFHTRGSWADEQLPHREFYIYLEGAKGNSHDGGHSPSSPHICCQYVMADKWTSPAFRKFRRRCCCDGYRMFS